MATQNLQTNWMRAGDKVRGGIKDDLRVSGQVLELRLPWYLSVKKYPPANAGDSDSKPGSGRSPGEGTGNPLPLFLPGESHGQRSLVDCSPWGCKRIRHDLATKQYSFSKHLLILFTLYQVPIQMMGIEDKMTVSSPF